MWEGVRSQESESGGLKPLAVCIPWIYIGSMTTTLQAWGNSQGVRIPKALLKALHLKTGMRLELDLSPSKDAIIVKPSQDAAPLRGRYRIEDLVAKMPHNYKSQEFFSEVRRCEVW
jgi:antitoxin component of MazEF toxin-antitoxin module